MFQRRWAMGSLIFGLATAACTKSPPTAPAKESFRVAASVESGAEGGGRLKLHLAAQSGFKVNDEYPLSFTPRAQPGVTFEQSRYPLKDSAEKTPCEKNPEEVCEVTAAVPFAATGEARQVGGVLSMSVCNPEQCLIEKVPVTVELPSN